MDIYQTVTDKIVAGLETAASWQKPWTSAFKPRGDRNAALQRPLNAITKKPYRGINTWMLWAAQQESPYWATYKAWAGTGAQVRKGEKASHIVFWSRVNRRNWDGESGEQETYLLARGYCVFNASQVDGWQAPASPLPVFKPVAPAPQFVASPQIDAWVEKTGATIKHGGDKAYYTQAGDYVAMPHAQQFVGSAHATAAETYYSTLFHELTHWTGNEKRCTREFGKRFGDEAYAFEELVAELGAAYLCADQMMLHEPRADHAAYIKTWISVLKNDKRAIFTAASKAEKAVAFLTGLQAQEDEEAAEAIAA